MGEGAAKGTEEKPLRQEGKQSLWVFKVWKVHHGGKSEQLCPVRLPGSLRSRLRLDHWACCEGSLLTVTRVLLENWGHESD